MAWTSHVGERSVRARHRLGWSTSAVSSPSMHRSTDVQECRCAELQMRGCREAQMCSCAELQMFRIGDAQMYRRADAQMYRRTNVQVYRCTVDDAPWLVPTSLSVRYQSISMHTRHGRRCVLKQRLLSAFSTPMSWWIFRVPQSCTTAQIGEHFCCRSR